MHAALSCRGQHRGDELQSLKFRAPTVGMGSALRSIRSVRRTVMRATRAKKWSIDAEKWRTMLAHLHTDLQTTQHEVGAEVSEFIQSPHLLFAPIRIALALAFPMAIPLCFMPSRLLCLYGLFVVSWYVACLLFFATEVAMRPPWYRKGLPSKELPPYWKGFVHNPLIDLGSKFQEVEFSSYNSSGLLRGWYVEKEVRTGMAVLFVHGVGRDRRAFLRHSADFLAAGYACLFFDLSEHGLSDSVHHEMPRGTLFGAREQNDVIAAAEYLRMVRGATKIAMVGTSCGASSAILAAARRPDLASCVVAENPFTRADDLLQHHLNSLSKNYLSQNNHQTVRRAMFWLAGKMLMIRMGYFFRSYGALDAASRLRCPLLVAHSTEDSVVPFEHGVKIYEAAARAMADENAMVVFLKYHEAAHCALYDKDPELWTGTVLPFVRRSFERGDAEASDNSRCDVRRQ